MNTPMLRFSLPAVVLTLVLGLGACGGGGGGGNGPGPQRLDLVIGNELPLSGDSKTLGQSGGKASSLALRQIQRAIGGAGADHKVRIADQDEGADPETSVAAARSLVDGQGATCLTGPWSSAGVARVAEDVSIPAEVLEISPVATGDDVADLNDHDLVDSTALPVSTEGEAISAAIGRALGGIQGQTVNVAANADSSSSTIKTDFVEAWQKDDGTVGEQAALPPAPPGAAQISAGGPAATLLIDDPAGFSQLAPALGASPGWSPVTAWGSDQLVSPGLAAEAGVRAVQGMRALAPGAPSGAPPTAAFADGFASSAPPRVKQAPFAAQEFDATILCYLAAVAAGSTEGREMADELIDITAPGGTRYSWQQLPQAIKALEDGEDIDYTGASGPVDMDVHGNATKGVFDVYRYSKGGLEVVDEVPVEQPNPATP
jgi:ABC-type branched-subunit amino acid transport system substrate-binding protein